MDSIASISELLTLSQSQYRIYDMGRRITKLSKAEFNQIEENQIPYPYPSQGHAFLAISFWQNDKSKSYLWFIKLPLDERGLLNQGARNHFIAIIIEALGSDLSVNPSEKQEELLKSNPYHFQPAQYKLASLNSLLHESLKLAPSQYFSDTLAYFENSENLDNWQHIGVQGLADFAVKCQDSKFSTKLSNALKYLPEPVLNPLCSALENHKLPHALLSEIIDIAKQTEPSDKLHNLVRALGASCDHALVISYLEELITKDILSEELIIILSGRCWEIFTQQKLLLAFLEHIAQYHPSDLFAGIFKDLVAIPSIRPVLFSCMRSPDRSPMLAKAIGQLFSPSQNSASVH